jgi:uncharacterized protein with ParB-like and HNH nuclease domain
MFKNIAIFNNTNDYIPLFNGVMITDLFVILLLNTNILKSRVLREWYSKYNLSAVIADVLIILIGLIITRYIYYSVFASFSIIKFVFLAVVVQIIHDILFYVLFTNIPRGVNQMMDTFKDYADEVSYKAILSDSGMMVMASLAASYFASQSANTNIIIMIVSLYIMPYFIYNN